MRKIIAFYESLGIDLNDLNHPISELIYLAIKKEGIEKKTDRTKIDDARFSINGY